MAGQKAGRGEQSAKLTRLEDEIMHRFAAGETAVSIYRDLGISKFTFYEWINNEEHPERLKQFYKSRELGAHAMVDDSIALLDDARQEKNLTSAQASIAREQSQSRRWWAARLAAMYRDKVEVNTTIDFGAMHLEALIVSNGPRSQEIENQIQEGNRRRIAAGLELPEAEIEILPVESEATDEFRADRNTTVADKIRVAFEKRNSG